MIRRHTANLEKAFNLEEPWQFLVRLFVPLLVGGYHALR
jgi:hypothetical protein